MSTQLPEIPHDDHDTTCAETDAAICPNCEEPIAECICDDGDDADEEDEDWEDDDEDWDGYWDDDEDWEDDDEDWDDEDWEDDEAFGDVD